MEVFLMPSVLITGGTRGIGLALSKAFAQKGWKVTSCYHQDEISARESQKEVSKISNDYLLSKCDVALAGTVDEMVRRSVEKWGGLDCVIHNAGATWNARILNIEEAQWDDTLNVHLKGAFHLAKSCLRPMLKQKSGQFLFISSVVATTGNIGQGSYTVAKAGVIGFMRSLAREYGSKNIRANAVCPGFHKTKLADNLSPEAEEAIRKKHLLNSTTDLNEVTEFVTWLAGTQSISGQVFNLDSRLPGWL
jgi:3-oxoacyl-[acyl-carrier protein] reductase